MKQNAMMTALALLAGVCAIGGSANGDFTKWDPRMAAESAIADADGVKWIDGRHLPIEGRAFANVDTYYERLPKTVTTNVNAGVRDMKRHTAGLQFRFTTTSPWICCRWVPSSRKLDAGNMSSSGVSGIDIYTCDETGNWRFTRAGGIDDGKNGAWPTGSVNRVWIRPGTPILVNLPLYNGLKSFELGIDAKGTVAALGPRKSGIEKPVVFYGTSITHGGSATRPGLAFVNQVGRDLDVPVVNLGFSGSGRMEFEMSDHLAAIDASCYVLDCLWNMDFDESERAGRAVTVNYEPFIRNLRAKRPDVPIVMAEQCDVFCKGPNEKDRFIRALYDRLVAEGWKNLVYLPKTRMYDGDREGTVDGCHPNDRGMLSMSKAFGGAVRSALERQTNK